MTALYWYDLAHAAEWELHTLHDLQVSWVGSETCSFFAE